MIGLTNINVNITNGKEIKSTFTYGMISILGIITILIILFNMLLKDKKILSNLLKILL